LVGLLIESHQMAGYGPDLDRQAICFDNTALRYAFWKGNGGREEDGRGDGIREFILVVNSNLVLDPILHRFRDTAA